MNKLKHEQLLLSLLNKKGQLYDAADRYESIFLSLVSPDPENARFFPAVFIKDQDAQLFIQRKLSKAQLIKIYDAENHVIVGKSCIINCLNSDTPQWKSVQHTIKSIIELGENISITELIQAPSVYPLDDGTYRILTGHRRFFALVYAHGYDSAAQFKLYESEPLLPKIKQFQENASREDLSQYGKLVAFKQAIAEIENVNSARLKIGLKKLTVKDISHNLGISMGAFDNYNVLTRYNTVLKAYEKGLSLPFVHVKKVVTTAESEYKQQHNKTQLNLSDIRIIEKEIERKLMGDKTPTQSHKAVRVKPIQSLNTVKQLLTSNIMALDLGIDWDNVDWENYDSVASTLSTVLKGLEAMDTKR
ncbi:hypothetical protein [Pseudoalteromonas sp. T1lg23B]|uniref:hypothetical protein n=1 Tax=Pseudoalteromonas sp. T1lg23B TaxID=2077097 RepID=UPI000CF65A94|nr:hypothetical protein [Pseudoalteromonas sp. T1lg23B]